jgi:hypothetical protein
MDSFLMVGDETPIIDVFEIVGMVMDFRREFDTEKRLVQEPEIYLEWFNEMYAKGTEFYYVKDKGYLVVEPQYDKLLRPEYAKSYFLSAIYVRPEHRKGRIYGVLAHGILKKYKSNMIGSAMLDGVHDKVLGKRFKQIASVYDINQYWNKEKSCLQ